MARFTGSYNHTIDAKNRMFIPAQFRKGLGEEGEEFVVMKSPSPEKCLFVYPREEWELIEYELDKMSPGADERKKYRLIYSRTENNSLDKQGRVQLRDDFCKYAGLEKDVVVLGAGKRIEIWAEEEWNKMLSETEDNDFDWNSIPW